MKDVRDGGNVDESRFPPYTQRRRLGRWLRPLAAACLALAMAGGFTMVASGHASGASAHVLASNDPCYMLSAKAADQLFCLTVKPGDTQVQLTWTPSAQGDNVTVYQGDAQGNGQPATVKDVTVTSALVTGLTNGTTYYFWLVADNTVTPNIVSPTTAVSNRVSATPIGPPGLPTALAATPGNGTVTLTWDAPASNGGSPIKGYNVYQGTSPGGETGPVNGTRPVTSPYTAKDLTNGTTYYFTVTAVNDAGNSKPSNEVSATPATVPEPPLSLTATPGDGKVTLTWTAPRSDGGSDVTGYNIYYATSADFKAATKIPWGTDTAVTVTGLVNGATYYFWVTAVNKVGVGKPSSAVPATPVGPPGAPTGLAAAAGNGQVTLTWVKPGSDGGSPVTGYNVSYATSANLTGATVVHGGTDTSLVVNRLVNGTTYYFRVTAINRVGKGPASGEAKAVPVGVPGAPAGLTATRGDAKVALAWTAPGSNGGSPVTGYNVYVATSADFKGATKIPRGTGTAVTVTGLVNGTTYYFRVTAVNRLGAGPASAAAKAVPATVPGTPAGLTATPGKSKVTLRWAAPPSGGSPITGYIIYKGTSPGGETGPAVNGLLVTATSYAVTGLVNAAPYYFEVFAVNAVGQGSSSNEASATLPPFVPPTSPTSPAPTVTSPTAPAFGVPTGLTATAGDTKVHLSWTAPASDGGSPVAGYKIYVATTPDAQQSTMIVTAKSADATVTHLVNGTTYYFMVTAVNTVGHESPFSTEVSAEPARVGTQVKVSADSPTVPPQLIALITAAAAMVTAAGFTLIMRGRSRVGSRKRTHSKHSHEAEVGSDVRAVADAVRLDAVSVRDIGQQPTHTVRFEPHPGVSTTTIKEGGHDDRY